VQPLVGGIYTADAEKLSIRAALPRFVEMERRHGSLIRGLRRQPDGGSAQAGSGARYSMFVAPREGISSLVDALAARLPPGTVELNRKVDRLERGPAGWLVHGSGDPQPRCFDAAIVTTPAPQAARLLEKVDARAADDLSCIPYAGCAIALVGYRREQIGHPLDGFGFVVPEMERRRILACSFSSQKFPGRAPAECVLLRIFVGGAQHPEMSELPDDRLRTLVMEELRDLLKARGEPMLFEVVRWHAAMPQYHLGHCERVERIERAVAALPGLALAGNAYHGVGIPDCIHSGELAAERILQVSIMAGGG
jgi:oxygen-dependent protoporphyrinogen oxidase